MFLKKCLLALTVFFLIFMSGCNYGSGVFAINTEKLAEEYVKSQGYKIIENKGEIYRYKLEKDLLNHSVAKNSLYRLMWSVQKTEPDKYFGKEIIVYCFATKNHPLSDIYKSGIDLFVLVSDKKVVGGYSMPQNVRGWAHTLDGKTLEEVTGLNYQKWYESWEKKYGN